MDQKPSIEIFKSYIKQNKLRSTPERDNILNETMELEKHFNAEELFRLLRKKNHKVVLATVYNTLDLLVSAGILTKHRLGAEHTYYERAYNKPGHHHLICIECRKIIEFVAEDLSDYERTIAKKNNFQIQSATHQIFGKCTNCQ
jgi:Fur family transcriptional regulator, ferric uptake regulator